MTEKMLKFVKVNQQTPNKRKIGKRIDDFNEIYDEFINEKAREQSSRCSQCGVPFCQIHCPLHNNIPDWLKLTAEGRLKEASELAHSTNNMPEICGRICPQDRLCEGNCVIEQSGHGTVTIGSIEKYIIEKAFEMGWKPDLSHRKWINKKVAIVGSGPAGIACADILTRSGIHSHVYDKNDEIGGLLTYGIPEFKLEKSVVQRRRKILEEMGIKFHLGKEVGKDVPFKKLYNDYDAVFLAMGTYTSLEGGFKGEKLPGVYKAIDYLISNTKKLLNMDTGKAEHINFKGKKVVILGGGDTAMDCNRTAIRQGAKSVTCLYRRDEKNMPGSRREVKNAKEEGVIFDFNIQPIDILGNEKVEGVKTVTTELGDIDQNGRRVPIPIPGSEKIYDADVVIVAFGFRASPASWFNDFNIETKKNGLVIAEEEQEYKFQTSNNKIFSGGDMVRGSDLVVTAIWEGREAGKSIIKYVS